jgi:hypothetical protein
MAVSGQLHSSTASPTGNEIQLLRDRDRLVSQTEFPSQESEHNSLQSHGLWLGEQDA